MDRIIDPIKSIHSSMITRYIKYKIDGKSTNTIQKQSIRYNQKAKGIRKTCQTNACDKLNPIKSNEINKDRKIIKKPSIMSQLNFSSSTMSIFPAL